ncbi:MAG: hypothetical protein IPN13_11810 [Bacteroidetes bacterium]|nr:hypothetical protein [Bacteroidota bacterium]
MKPKETKVTRKSNLVIRKSPVEAKMELLQSHLLFAQLIINQILEECQNSLAGVIMTGKNPYGGRYSRWGYSLVEFV